MKKNKIYLQHKKAANKALKKDIFVTALERCSGKVRENSYVDNKKLIDIAAENDLKLGYLKNTLIKKSKY